MHADAGGRKQRCEPLIRLFQALERAGEKVQGVLAHGDDGGVFSRLLQGNPGNHASQAASHYNSVKFHFMKNKMFTLPT